MDTYEHTRDFDRDGCIVGARQVSYAQLLQRYVCRECGGQPVHKIARIDDLTRDWAECAQCGERDFIPQWLYDRQCIEHGEIIENLPPVLQELFPMPEPLDITVDQAIADLFD